MKATKFPVKMMHFSDEDQNRWRGAISATWQAIGQDLPSIEDEKPWIQMEIVLDADHVMYNGGIKKEDYMILSKAVTDTITEIGYNKAMKEIYKWWHDRRRAA